MVVGMMVSATLASIYSVGLIAIDRYAYIVHGIAYPKLITYTKTKVAILTAWLIGRNSNIYFASV